MTKGVDEFKVLIKENIIPRLEKMLKLELAHTTYLESLKEVSNLDWLQTSINTSRESAQGIQANIKEYKEYVNTPK